MDGSSFNTRLSTSTLIHKIKEETRGKHCYQVRRIVASLCHNTPVCIINSGYRRNNKIIVELAERRGGKSIPPIIVTATETDDLW